MKFQRMEKDVAVRQEETAQLIVSRIQRKAPEPTFCQKGNEWKFSFNRSVDSTIKDAAAVLDKLKLQAATILKTVKGQLQEGVDAIVMQQKLIHLADSSECG